MTKQISHPPARGNDDILVFTLPGTVIPIIARRYGPPFTGTLFTRHHPAAQPAFRTTRSRSTPYDRQDFAFPLQRLLAVLNVLFKYACARQAARASS